MRALWTMVSVSFAADRKNALLLCLTVPLGWLAPAGTALATKVLVDAAVSGQAGTAVLAGALAALSAVLIVCSMLLGIYLIHALGKQTEAYLDQRLGRLVTSLPGIEHYERPEYLDQVQMLREQSGMVGAGLNATVQMSAAVCQVVLVCGLLAQQEPWMLLLVVFAFPSFLGSVLARRLAVRAQERTAEPDRLLHALIRLASDLPAGREARLFDLGGELISRRRRLTRTVNADRNRALLYGNGLRLIGRMIFGAGYLGAIWLVLRRAARGETAPGDVAMIIVLAGQVEGFLGSLIGGAQFMLSVHQVTERLRWLESYSARSRRPGSRGAPRRLQRGIRLHHVSFGYPGAGRVLQDISAELPAGAVVALVGDNGAGKTSLVKLLLGLYAPSAGDILIDGEDLQQLDPVEWRSRVAATFQDFCKLEFRTKETIGVGDIPRRDDGVALRRAAANAGAAEIVRALPHQWDTQLGAAWPGGVELSGGQWQRVALARGQMRDDPLLLVLDEPTAALDAETEHALFERFAALARTRRDTGAITLLVSHRFSTVRAADVILVVDNGVIREHGSHDELIRAGGLYAELYSLQAHGYA